MIIFILLTSCASSRLNIVSEEYRAQWKEDYNYNTPILISSMNSWNKFSHEHPTSALKDDELKNIYDEEFFKDNIIYAYIKSEPSGSNRLEVIKAELDGTILKLYMKRIVPGSGTDDMSARVCLFGIKKDKIKNIEVVEAIIRDKS